VTFDLSGIEVPTQVIYGLAFSTTDYGASPTTGFSGPDDSLNIQLVEGSPAAGINPLPDTAYFESSEGSNYTDGGAAGTGTFRQDQGWTPYGSGAAQFMGNPVPSRLPSHPRCCCSAPGWQGWQPDYFGRPGRRDSLKSAVDPAALEAPLKSQCFRCSRRRGRARCRP